MLLVSIYFAALFIHKIAFRGPMYKEEVFQNVLFKVGFCKMPAMIKRKLKVKAG